MVGASASGTQIADELARAGRARRPRRRQPHPDAAPLPRHGRVLVARADRQARPRRRRPGDRAAAHDASRRSSWSGREQNDHRGADLDLTSLQDAGVELVGRLARVHRHRVDFRPRPRADRSRGRRPAGPVPRRGRRVRRRHPPRRRGRARRPAASACPYGRPRTRLDLRAEGIGTVLLATGFRPHHPWLNVPVVAPDGRIRQYRGVTAAPGLYVVGQRFQHRRDSAFIDGARFTTPTTSSPTCAPASSAPSRRADRAMSRLRRRRRRRPGRRRLDRDAAGPGRRPGRRPRPGQYGTDTLSTHALMRAGVLQLSRWGLLAAHRRGGHPAGPVVTFHYDERRAGADLDPPERRAWTRSTPRAGTCSTGSSSTPPPRPGAEVLPRDPGHRPAARRHRPGGRRAWSATATATPRASRPTSSSARTASASVVARAVGAATLRQGDGRAPCSTRYFAGSEAAGYEWAYGDGAAAGLIPTNDGQALRASSRTTPERMRALRVRADGDRDVRRPAGGWPHRAGRPARPTPRA